MRIRATVDAYLYCVYGMCQYMRPSPLKNTLAVLRRAIGPEMTQKEMARILKRSPVTVQKIELNQLPLGESLAQEISFQTGVSLEWLLLNDLSRPPLNSFGEPYSRDSFEQRQAAIRSNTEFYGGAIGVGFQISHQFMNLAAVAASSLKSEQYPLFIYKCARAIEALEKQFGLRKDFFGPKDETITVSAYHKKTSLALERLFQMIEKLPPVKRRLRKPGAAIVEFQTSDQPTEQIFMTTKKYDAFRASLQPSHRPQHPRGSH